MRQAQLCDMTMMLTQAGRNPPLQHKRTYTSIGLLYNGFDILEYQVINKYTPMIRVIQRARFISEHLCATNYNFFAQSVYCHFR